MPLIHRRAGAGYLLAAANRECRLENRSIRLLLHEQRDVLEGVVVVHAETAANDMLSSAGQIISESYARAKALAVVGGFLGHQGRRQGAEGGGRLEFLEGPAVGDVRSADKVEVLVPAQAEVEGQALAQLPVILDAKSKLLTVLDDRGRVANRDAHAGHEPGIRKPARRCQDLAR